MDDGLIRRAQEGDADAFEALVRPRVAAVHARCLAVIRAPEDADDAAQEALVTAWRRLPTLRDPARFDAWLAAIATNAARDLLRRRRRIREVPFAELEARPAPAQPPERLLDLEAAFAELPPASRAVAEPFYLRDEPVDAIGARLGIPTGTVKSRLFHARARLRRTLGKG